MKNMKSIELLPNKEERLPGFSPDFPYISTRAQIDEYDGRLVPWHWHRPVELFYMESGVLEYYTTKGSVLFTAGMGGFVNSNVLHMTKPMSAHGDKTIQLLHIFDPDFISGHHGSRIETKYVMPIITAPQIEIAAFSPEHDRHAQILRLIRNAFEISDQEIGCEIKIREALSQIWLLLFDLLSEQIRKADSYDKNDDRLKMMMIYIHEHYAEKISISDLADAAYLSERACFRLFRNYLHTTPTDYIRSCRLQEACRLLVNSQESIADIGYACGLGDSSYFSRIFKDCMNCTPVQYRKKWQDNPINCPK